MSKTQNKAFIIHVSDTTEKHKAIGWNKMEARQQRLGEQKARTFRFRTKTTTKKTKI